MANWSNAVKESHLQTLYRVAAEKKVAGYDDPRWHGILDRLQLAADCYSTQVVLGQVPFGLMFFDAGQLAGKPSDLTEIAAKLRPHLPDDVYLRFAALGEDLERVYDKQYGIVTQVETGRPISVLSKTRIGEAKKISGAEFGYMLKDNAPVMIAAQPKMVRGGYSGFDEMENAARFVWGSFFEEASRRLTNIRSGLWTSGLFIGFGLTARVGDGGSLPSPRGWVKGEPAWEVNVDQSQIIRVELRVGSIYAPFALHWNTVLDKCMVHGLKQHGYLQAITKRNRMPSRYGRLPHAELVLDEDGNAHIWAGAKDDTISIEAVLRHEKPDSECYNALLQISQPAGRDKDKRVMWLRRDVPALNASAFNQALLDLVGATLNREKWIPAQTKASKYLASMRWRLLKEADPFKGRDEQGFLNKSRGDFWLEQWGGWRLLDSKGREKNVEAAGVAKTTEFDSFTIERQAEFWKEMIVRQSFTGINQKDKEFKSFKHVRLDKDFVDAIYMCANMYASHVVLGGSHLVTDSPSPFYPLQPSQGCPKVISSVLQTNWSKATTWVRDLLQNARLVCEWIRAIRNQSRQSVPYATLLKNLSAYRPRMGYIEGDPFPDALITHKQASFGVKPKLYSLPPDVLSACRAMAALLWADRFGFFENLLDDIASEVKSSPLLADMCFDVKVHWEIENGKLANRIRMNKSTKEVEFEDQSDKTLKIDRSSLESSLPESIGINAMPGVIYAPYTAAMYRLLPGDGAYKLAKTYPHFVSRDDSYHWHGGRAIVEDITPWLRISIDRSGMADLDFRTLKTQYTYGVNYNHTSRTPAKELIPKLAEEINRMAADLAAGDPKADPLRDIMTVEGIMGGDALIARMRSKMLRDSQHLYDVGEFKNEDLRPVPLDGLSTQIARALGIEGDTYTRARLASPASPAAAGLPVYDQSGVVLVEGERVKDASLKPVKQKEPVKIKEKAMEKDSSKLIDFDSYTVKDDSGRNVKMVSSYLNVDFDVIVSRFKSTNPKHLGNVHGQVLFNVYQKEDNGAEIIVSLYRNRFNYPVRNRIGKFEAGLYGGIVLSLMPIFELSKAVRSEGGGRLEFLGHFEFDGRSEQRYRLYPPASGWWGPDPETQGRRLAVAGVLFMLKSVGVSGWDIEVTKQPFDSRPLSPEQIKRILGAGWVEEPSKPVERGSGVKVDQPTPAKKTATPAKETSAPAKAEPAEKFDYVWVNKEYPRAGKFGATPKQIGYIESLLRRVQEPIEGFYDWARKNDLLDYLTKTEASKVIDALLKGVPVIVGDESSFKLVMERAGQPVKTSEYQRYLSGKYACEDGGLVAELEIKGRVKTTYDRYQMRRETSYPIGRFETSRARVEAGDDSIYERNLAKYFDTPGDSMYSVGIASGFVLIEEKRGKDWVILDVRTMSTAIIEDMRNDARIEFGVRFREHAECAVKRAIFDWAAKKAGAETKAVPASTKPFRFPTKEEAAKAAAKERKMKASAADASEAAKPLRPYAFISPKHNENLSVEQFTIDVIGTVIEHYGDLQPAEFLPRSAWEKAYPPFMDWREDDRMEEGGYAFQNWPNPLDDKLAALYKVLDDKLAIELYSREFMALHEGHGLSKVIGTRGWLYKPNKLEERKSTYRSGREEDRAYVSLILAPDVWLWSAYTLAWNYYQEMSSKPEGREYAEFAYKQFNEASKRFKAKTTPPEPSKPEQRKGDVMIVQPAPVKKAEPAKEKPAPVAKPQPVSTGDAYELVIEMPTAWKGDVQGEKLMQFIYRADRPPRFGNKNVFVDPSSGAQAAVEMLEDSEDVQGGWHFRPLQMGKVPGMKQLKFRLYALDEWKPNSPLIRVAVHAQYIDWNNVWQSKALPLLAYIRKADARAVARQPVWAADTYTDTKVWDTFKKQAPLLYQTTIGDAERIGAILSACIDRHEKMGHAAAADFCIANFKSAPEVVALEALDYKRRNAGGSKGFTELKYIIAEANGRVLSPSVMSEAPLRTKMTMPYLKEDGELQADGSSGWQEYIFWDDHELAYFAGFIDGKLVFRTMNTARYIRYDDKRVSSDEWHSDIFNMAVKEGPWGTMRTLQQRANLYNSNGHDDFGSPQLVVSLGKGNALSYMFLKPKTDVSSITLNSAATDYNTEKRRQQQGKFIPKLLSYNRPRIRQALEVAKTDPEKAVEILKGAGFGPPGSFFYYNIQTGALMPREGEAVPAVKTQAVPAAPPENENVHRENENVQTTATIPAPSPKPKAKPLPQPRPVKQPAPVPVIERASPPAPTARKAAPVSQPKQYPSPKPLPTTAPIAPKTMRKTKPRPADTAQGDMIPAKHSSKRLVAAIKAFKSYEGRELTRKEVKGLHEQVTSALSAAARGDYFRTLGNWVRRTLEKMQDSGNFPTKPLKFAPATSHKLLCFEDDCNAAWGKIQLSGVASAADVAAADFQTWSVPGQYGGLLGNVADGFHMVIWGLPGSGKSTFALGLANALASLSPTLYVSAEEGPSATMQERLRRIGAADNLFISGAGSVDQARNAIAEGDYQFVVLDSVDTLRATVEDVERLKADFPDTAFISIHQATKLGQMRGSLEYAHNADVIVKVESGKAETTKNRFAQLSAVDVAFGGLEGVPKRSQSAASGRKPSGRKPSGRSSVSSSTGAAKGKKKIQFYSKRKGCHVRFEAKKTRSVFCDERDDEKKAREAVQRAAAYFDKKGLGFI